MALARWTVAALTLLVVSGLSIPALVQLRAACVTGWSDTVRDQGSLIVIAAGVALVASVARRVFSLPLAIFWSWNFVFMGLAPAYQLSANSFPWNGHLSVSDVESAQQLIIFGDVVAMAALKFIGSRRGRVVERGRTSPPSSVPRRLTATRLAYTYALIAGVFIVLMGPALYQARAAFRARLLEIAQLPFGGTLYFVVTAGAIALPATLIAARRHGYGIPIHAIAVSLLAAAVATNPLLGSRFLTGSFVVAVGAAVVGDKFVIRLLPALSVVLLVVLFPSLDTLRGDGSGAATVALSTPEQALLDPDFDAFEMLGRESSLDPEDREALPSRTTLAVAPVARWIPIVARPFLGASGGASVAEGTGMHYTNVSMPLWGEGHLIAGWPGVAIVMAALGGWLALASRHDSSSYLDTIRSPVSAPASAALLFIVLRGSLYEVFGYVVLVLVLARQFPVRTATGSS